MHSMRANQSDNPWNALLADAAAADECTGRRYSHQKSLELLRTGSGRSDDSNRQFGRFPTISSDFIAPIRPAERTLTKPVLANFCRGDDIICCGMCGGLVLKNAFRQHYDIHHLLDTSNKDGMIQSDCSTKDNKTMHHKVRKVRRRCKKKRPKVQDKPSAVIEPKVVVDGGRKCKKKLKSKGSKRHAQPLHDDSTASGYYRKKLRCDSGSLWRSPSKAIVGGGGTCSGGDHTDDPLCQDDQPKSIKLGSYDSFCCFSDRLSSYDSVNRTSSDSSTPPSLSLGTVQTLSSPSSLTAVAIQDPSSVVTDHYHLPSSNDLTPDRSGASSCCRYQIDSLPWENMPPANKSSITMDEGCCFASQIVAASQCTGIGDEDEEIERAVQSITSLYDDSSGVGGGAAHHLYLDVVNNLVDSNSFSSNRRNGIVRQQPVVVHKPIITTDVFATAEDSAVIDSFLDEIIGGSQQQSVAMGCGYGLLESLIVDQNEDDGDDGQQQHNLLNNHHNTNDLFMEDDDCCRLDELIGGSGCIDPSVVSHHRTLPMQQHQSHHQQQYLHHQSVSMMASPMDRRPQPPPSSSTSSTTDTKLFDPLRHCGVVGANGSVCYRGLLCKHHTMPQKRLVQRPQSITALIKAKKMQRKSIVDLKTNSNSNGAGCPDASTTTMMVPSFNALLLRFKELMTTRAAVDAKPMMMNRYGGELQTGSCGRSLVGPQALLWRHRPRARPDKTSSSLLTTTSQNRQTCEDQTRPACRLSQGSVSGWSQDGDAHNSQDIVKSQPVSVAIMDSNGNLQQQHQQAMALATTDCYGSLLDVNGLTLQGQTFDEVHQRTTTAAVAASVGDHLVYQPVAGGGLALCYRKSGDDCGTTATAVLCHGQQQTVRAAAGGQPILMVMNGGSGQKILGGGDHHQKEYGSSVGHQDTQQQMTAFGQAVLAVKPTHLVTTTQHHHLQQHQQRIISISPMGTTADDCCRSTTEKSISDKTCPPQQTQHQQVIYQIGTGAGGSGHFLSTGGLPKPLTVQQQSPTGVTQKFLILPDGTISAITAAAAQSTHHHQQHQQHHPLFATTTTAATAGQYFINGGSTNGDKIIIQQATAAATATQSILMPHIIGQPTTIIQQHPQQQQQVISVAAANKQQQQHHKGKQTIKLEPSLDQQQQSLVQKAAAAGTTVSFRIPAAGQNHATAAVTAATTTTGAFLITSPSSAGPMKHQQIILSTGTTVGDGSSMKVSSLVEGDVGSKTMMDGQTTAMVDGSQLLLHDHLQRPSVDQDHQSLLGHHIQHQQHHQSIIIQQPSTPRMHRLTVDDHHLHPPSGPQHILINGCFNSGATHHHQQQQQQNVGLPQCASSFTIGSGHLTHHHHQAQQQQPFKAGPPPPLVISQHLLHGSKQQQPYGEGQQQQAPPPPPYQQYQQQQQLIATAADDGHIAGELVIMQSMLA